MRGRLEAAAAALAAAGVETPRVDAEWLLAGLLGVRRLDLALGLDARLAADVAEAYARAVARRAGREPLQRIVGWEEFRGLRLRLTPDVLVPRPETEALVEWALGLLPPAGGQAPLVVDVGTGAGGIACSVARERPDARVVAVDVSPAAAAVAAHNVRALGLSGRVGVVVGDLAAAVRGGQAHLVLANLPYLPAAVLGELMPEVRLHEPRLALDGGPDGLDAIRGLVRDARRILAPGGVLALETAGGAQARAAAALARGAGLSGVGLATDLAGVERFVAGRAEAG